MGLFSLDLAMRPYLSLEQVGNIPLSCEYKKKSIGGSIIFKKVLFDYNGQNHCVELAGKNGFWVILPEEVDRLFGKLELNVPIFQSELDEKSIHQMKVKYLSQKTGWKGFSADFQTSSFAIPHWKKQMTREKYFELYSNYPDPVELHYFDSDSPEHIRIQNVAKEVPDNTIVLDVGCNSGYIGKALLEKNCTVFGIDLNDKLVERAKQKGIQAVGGWAEEMPFSNESFDIVVMSYLLEHVLEPKKVLGEAFRVLKFGGKLVGSVPTEYGDWGENNLPFHSEHLRFYTKPLLKAELLNSKFINISIKQEWFRGRNVADSYLFTGKKEEKNHEIQ